MIGLSWNGGYKYILIRLIKDYLSLMVKFMFNKGSDATAILMNVFSFSQHAANSAYSDTTGDFKGTSSLRWCM